jgi:hypothetical protein
MPVAIAIARHRPLPAQIERAKRVDLGGVRRADRHPVLLLHVRVGSGRLHAPELDRRPGVLVEVGQQRRGGDGFGREPQRRAGAHRAGRGGNRRAIARHQAVADAVVGLGAIEIGLHDAAAGDLPLRDGAMHVANRRLLDEKRAGRRRRIL